MPATWKDGPLKAPRAKEVILGYLEAFDPDILVQFPKELPPFITAIGLEVITADDVWKRLDNGRSLSPQFGVGILEILNEIFQENFKFKAKYPVKGIFPKLPQPLSLFGPVFSERFPLN